MQTPVLPPSLILEINHNCNFNCPWCYCVWHETPEQRLRNLSMETWKKIVALSAAAGVKSFQFTGGELTLRKGWRKLLLFARRQLPEGEISIFTNASRFTESDLRFCKKYKINISVSLQGLRTYGAMTGSRRSYRKVLELLMRAKELHQKCSVSVTVTKQNLAEIEDVCSAAALSGAGIVQLNAVMFAGRAQGKTDFVVPPAEWRALKERIRKLQLAIPVVWCEEISCLCEHPEAAYPDWKLAEIPACTTAGKKFGVFGPDGYFRKCLHTTEKLFYWKNLLKKEKNDETQN